MKADVGLVQAGDGVWVHRVPFRFMGMLQIGTRMTVLRLADGGVLLHSPVAIPDELAVVIEALGRVKWVVAPSLYHHLHAGDAIKRWPDARLLAPAALRKKRTDLRIDAHLEDAAPSAWQGIVEPIRIEGSMLEETVLYHRSSKTLVGADLFENFTTVDDFATRSYLKLGGVYGQPGWHRLLRVVYRDKKTARASVERLLGLDLARIVIAHGDLVTSQPKETLRKALGFLFD